MKKTKKDREFLAGRSVAQAARDNGVEPSVAHNRIHAKWSIEKACTTPVNKRAPRKKKVEPTPSDVPVDFTNPRKKRKGPVIIPPMEQMDLPLADEKATDMFPFLLILGAIGTLAALGVYFQ